jgi:mono/diheme cytochrome c family protein
MSRNIAVLSIVLLASTFACMRDPKPSLDAPLALSPIAAVVPNAVRLESRSRQGSLILSTRIGDAGEELALIADEDDRALLLVNVASGDVQAKYKVEGRPAQLLVLDNGQFAVAMRDKSKVVYFSVEASHEASAPYPFKFVEEATLYTDAEPLALARSSKTEGSNQLYVATGLGHTLEQFDLASQKKKFVFEIAQEPRAVVALEDGTVMVTHANAGVLTKIKGRDVSAMRLDQGDTRSRQGFALTSIGSEAFAPDTFVLPEDLSGAMRAHASGYGGGMVCEQNGAHPGWVLEPLPSTPKASKGAAEAATKSPQEKRTGKKISTVLASRQAGFANFDSEGRMPYVRSFDCVQVMSTSGALRRVSFTRALVTQLGTACILPRAAASHEGKREVYVACLGTNRIEAIDIGEDTEQGVPNRAPTYARGWSVPKGPLGLAVNGNVLLSWSQFDHSLTRINLNTGAASSVSIARDEAIDVSFALGRELFHAAGDARIAQDGRACASCHPDGRSDGIGWATPDGRRKPMVLAGRVGEGPFGWRGEHKTLREHLTKTITVNLHGSGLPKDAMAALETYVHALPPPPSSNTLSTEASRGKTLFGGTDTGCVACHHPDTGFTDGALHEVGTGGTFRTPPLKFASAAAPYMHEGKYGSIEDFLHATEGKMGHTAQLSEPDFNALVSYVKTL